MITRANGLLAGAVSVILGIAAHGLAGGYRPEGRQLLLLAAIGLGVAAIRGAQVDRAQQHRARGRSTSEWLAVTGVVAGGQLASHLSLSLLGRPSGHHTMNSAAMIGWHLAALPAAVIALCAISAVLRLLVSTVAALRVALPARPELTASVTPAEPAVALHDLTPRLSVGMRAPPVLG
ncbi:hypothetical protein MUG78_10075 [Gordonia alkaliphila]|uniref:hypothetical protein n=1 Tax=Gordonia alkaliphila TaxID=1053547 RepID=UPI001FF628AB|nr:hypothetical protein [Gordonia alkaliphila]MCK0439792.1 hypothetical protein [Gordonia alkaliphila]